MQPVTYGEVESGRFYWFRSGSTDDWQPVLAEWIWESSHVGGMAIWRMNGRSCRHTVSLDSDPPVCGKCGTVLDGETREFDVAVRHQDALSGEYLPLDRPLLSKDGWGVDSNLSAARAQIEREVTLARKRQAETDPEFTSHILLWGVFLSALRRIAYTSGMKIEGGETVIGIVTYKGIEILGPNGEQELPAGDFWLTHVIEVDSGQEHYELRESPPIDTRGNPRTRGWLGTLLAPADFSVVTQQRGYKHVTAFARGYVRVRRTVMGATLDVLD